MTFDQMRDKIKDALARFAAAIEENNPGDKAFVDDKVKRIAALHIVIGRAKTITQLGYVWQRLTLVVREVGNRLPASYFSQERCRADTAYAQWMSRRDKLIKRLWKIAPWVLVPYGANNGGRMCIAISAEERTAIVDEIELLAMEVPAIVAMFDAGSVRVSRRMWVPIIAPEQFRKIVYSENFAHSVLPNDVRYLKCTVDEQIEVLDVDEFLAERTWMRDQVSIRRASGSRFVARLWDAKGNMLRIHTHCILVDNADDLSRRISSKEPGARRIDAQEPAARWHCYDFIYYPDGRPSRPKKNR